MSNPLSNGRILSKSTDPRTYHAFNNGIERGSPEFTISRSELYLFDYNAEDWKNGGTENESTDSTEFGDLVDCMVLTPHLTDMRFVQQPETYPAPSHHADVKKGRIPIGHPLKWNNNSDYCDEWRRDHAGLTIVKSDAWKGAETAVSRLKSDAQIKEVLARSDMQVFVVSDFYDSDTNLTIRVRSLLDAVPQYDQSWKYHKLLVNLKTATELHPSRWSFVCKEHAYHWQAAMETDCYTAAMTDEDRCDYRHYICKNKAPYSVGKRILSDDVVQAGRGHYVRALKKYARCVATDIWPGFDDHEKSVDGCSVTDVIPSML